jgi:hypothetical protein
MARIFLFLSPRLVSLFKKIQIWFWNLFLNHFKSHLFQALVWTSIFESIFKSFRFEKSPKRSFDFFLDWIQFKFSLKVFESLNFEQKTLFKFKSHFCRPFYSILHFGPIHLDSLGHFLGNSHIRPNPRSAPSRCRPSDRATAPHATDSHPPTLGWSWIDAPPDLLCFPRTSSVSHRLLSTFHCRNRWS